MSVFASDKKTYIQHHPKLTLPLEHQLITSDTLSVSHTSLPQLCHHLHCKMLLTKNNLEA